MKHEAEGEGARLRIPSVTPRSSERVIGGVVGGPRTGPGEGVRAGERVAGERSSRARTATLLTDDGVRIEAAYRPPSPDAADDLCIVLAHGFSGALGRPALQRAAGVFAQFGGVVTFSFRGHGRSGGRSTVGDREVLDLDAAVRWAREIGHSAVAAVGFSMGGSVVLRHAGLAALAALAALAEAERDGNGNGTGTGTEGRTGARVDAVVSVSAPARWYYRGTAPMRRLHWVVTRPAGRAVSRLWMRTRIHPREWDPVPLSPVEAVRAIAPTPLLLVHGDRDAYFPIDHPVSLAEAAGPGCDLWIEPGFGHAENAADPELLRRIGGWLGGATRAAAG